MAQSCSVVFASKGQRLVLPDRLPGTRLRGRVTEDRTSVAGAVIRVIPDHLRTRRQDVFQPLKWPTDEDEPLRVVVSDAKGSFELPPLATGSYRLEIHYPGGRLLTTETLSVPPPHQLLARDEDPWEVAAVLDLGDLRLDPGARTEVLVTDTRGAPLAEARVSASQGDRPEDLLLFDTTTDARGIALLTGLAADRPVTVRCRQEGFTALKGSFEIPPTATHCEMEALAKIRGRILDDGETPPSGAVAWIDGTERRARADSEGFFDFDGLTAGPIRLLLSAPGFRTEERDLRTRPGEVHEMEAVHLLPGEEVEGTVVDRVTAMPISGARVSLTGEPGGQTSTDEDGAFRLVQDPDRITALEVTAPGYPIQRTEIPSTPDEILVELERGGRLHVVTSRSAEVPPCRGCAFTVQGSHESFELRTGVGGDVLSEILAPGHYRLSPVREQGRGTVVIVQGGDDLRRAEVRSGEITVVSMERPEHPLTVRVTPDPGPGHRLRAGGPAGDRLADLTGGTARIDLPSDEPLTFHLHTPSGASVRIGAIPAGYEREEVDLPLPVHRVTGRIELSADQPASHRRYRLLDDRGRVAASFHTEADGSFRLSHLPAGVYHLSTVASSGTVLRTFATEGDGETRLGSLLEP